jgi:hypothetical protein
MRNRVLLLALVLLVSAPGYSQSGVGDSASVGIAQKTGAESSLDVQEAALRYRIKTWTILSEVDCVIIEGKEAPPSFLARFKGTPVRPAAECEKQGLEGLPPSIYVIVDKQTKKHSTIFLIGAVRFLGPTDAEAVVSYEGGSQLKASDRYKLQLHGNVWSVVDVELLP